MRYRLASDKVVGKVLEDEAVVINLTTGMYFGLDGPSAKVWEHASAGMSREAIGDAAARAYPEQPDIRVELSGLLEQMCEAGLLAVADGDGTDGAAEIAWPPQYQKLEMTCYDDVAEMVALDPPLPELSYAMFDHDKPQAP